MSVETATGVVPRDHVVQFYERDDELVASVAEFLIDGLLGGEIVIVVATPQHTSAFEAAISQAGIDVSEMHIVGSLVVADPTEVLSRNVIGGRLNADGLAAEFGELITRAVDAGCRVRIYGEMVALLWDAGYVAAAIELEAQWNDLGRRLPFSLFCGYHAESVEADEHVDSLRHVCHLHSAVVAPSAIGAASVNPSVVARADDVRSFACALYSPSAARHFVAERLTAWGHADLVGDASIVVAELTTNAVVHARSEFVVAVTSHHDTIRVSVRDSGAVLPVPMAPHPHSVSGRGLMLVATIAHRWGSELIGDGKVIWAELATH